MGSFLASFCLHTAKYIATRILFGSFPLRCSRYEVYNVDVWLFIVSVVVGAAVLLLLLCGAIVSSCYRRCRGNPAKQRKQKRQ